MTRALPVKVPAGPEKFVRQIREYKLAKEKRHFLVVSGLRQLDPLPDSICHAFVAEVRYPVKEQ